MPNILVTGAGGFIGQHVVAHLRSAGLQELQAAVVTGLEWQQPDIQSVLQQQGIEHVIHLAGMAHAQVADAAQAQLHQVNALDTAALYQACQGAGVKSFVWLSTIKVLAETSALALTADAPLNPKGLYALSKAAGETLLQRARETQATTELAIVRPPLVYGPGVGANFLQLLVWARRGWPLPLARALAPRSMVGITNLVDVIHRAMSAPSGIYHVSDGDDWSVARLLQFCANQMDGSLSLLPLPIAVLNTLASLVGRAGIAQRLLQPLAVDIKATRTRLGWQPPVSVEQQLKDTVRWFLKQD